MTQKFLDGTSVGALRFKKYGECVLQRENLAALPSWEVRLHPVFGGAPLWGPFSGQRTCFTISVFRERAYSGHVMKIPNNVFIGLDCTQKSTH